MRSSTQALLGSIVPAARRYAWVGVLCWLLLGAATGWELWRRPGPAPELGPHERALVLAWVRKLVAAETSGVPGPTEAPRELAARSALHPVFVTVYGPEAEGRTHPLTGRWVPDEAGGPTSLEQALKAAASDLGRQLRERGQRLASPESMVLKLDLSGPRRRLWLGALWYLERVLDRGRHGVAASAGGEWAFALPARSVERGSDWRDVVTELTGKVGDSATLASYQTTSFVEGPPEEPGALPVFRGNVLVSELTPKAVRRALLEAGRYLARSIGADGRYCYVYLPYENRCTDEYNLLRHAGTTYSLYQLMGLFGRSEFEAPAEAATGWLRAQVRLVEGDPGRAFLLEGDRAKLGGTALAVLDLVERERVLRDGRDGELLGKLGRFLVSEVREDGYMRSYFPWRADVEVPAQNSIYYAGEALLALVRLYQLAPDPSYLAAAGRSASFLVHDRWKWAGMELFVPPDAWLAQALSELDAIAPATWLREYAHRIVEITDLSMLRASEGAPSDLVGGPASGPIFPGVTPAGARNEATTSVWRMAERSGDAKGAAHLRELALSSARFQLSQQYRTANSYYLPDPRRACGGFRGTAVENQVRIDYVQHNVTGLIGVLAMLEKTR